LLVIDEGFPRPRTQIHVNDGTNNAFLDMGWDEPVIGLDYDGELHQTSRPRFVHDIGRNEAFAQRRYPLRLRAGS
jgi:hypothetical protein